jgi:hypothetical protein
MELPAKTIAISSKFASIADELVSSLFKIDPEIEEIEVLVIESQAIRPRSALTVCIVKHYIGDRGLMIEFDSYSIVGRSFLLHLVGGEENCH